MTAIYALKDPRDGAIRYVGKTKLKISKRLSGHRNEKRQTRKCRWLAMLQREGLAPVVVILEEVPEAAWEESERFWIKWCRMAGFDLTNHTIGGDGVSGLDAAARRRLSEGMKARMALPGAKDYLSSPERAAKISAALRGTKHSPEHTAKLWQNRPGWKHSEETVARISAANRGHRWTTAELAALRVRNTGNQYGLGNRSRSGQTRSADERAKTSAACKGKIKSAEWREKMRQSKLRYWSQFTKEERRELLTKGRNTKAGSAE